MCSIIITIIILPGRRRGKRGPRRPRLEGLPAVPPGVYVYIYI